VTLLELLISATLFSLAMGGVYLLYTAMQETLSRGDMKTELQQNARIAIDRLVRELRMAGYGAGTPGEVLRSAGPTCLSFLWGGNEITYGYRDASLRRSDGGGMQAQAEAVRSLAFTYYDVDNRRLSPSAMGTCGGSSMSLLDVTKRGRVTRLTVTLQTASSLMSSARPGAGGQYFTPERYTLTADVRLRNR
jgi:hypothetical protein